MKRDIYKLSEWIEKTVRAGVADEQALRELKTAQKILPAQRHGSSAAAEAD